jgi:hypothetical protein
VKEEKMGLLTYNLASAESQIAIDNLEAGQKRQVTHIAVDNMAAGQKQQV